MFVTTSTCMFTIETSQLLCCRSLDSHVGAQWWFTLHVDVIHVLYHVHCFLSVIYMYTTCRYMNFHMH